MTAELMTFPTKRRRAFRSPSLWEIQRDGAPLPQNCTELAAVRRARREAADAQLITVQVTRRFWNAILELGRTEARKDEQQ
jgi:hypothetical protein